LQKLIPLPQADAVSSARTIEHSPLFPYAAERLGIEPSIGISRAFKHEIKIRPLSKRLKHKIMVLQIFAKMSKTRFRTGSYKNRNNFSPKG
jgi:hypothetical protein